MVDLKHIHPGFKSVGEASQQIFRLTMQAFSRPGDLQIMEDYISSTPYSSSAAIQILLAMLDSETSLMISNGAMSKELNTYLRFHTACNLTQQMNAAQFAYFNAGENMPQLSEMVIGSDEYPDQGATILIEVAELTVGTSTGVMISGPGIKDPKRIDVSGVSPTFWQERQALQKEFPKGVDILFCRGLEFIGLPRSTKVDI